MEQCCREGEEAREEMANHFGRRLAEKQVEMDQLKEEIARLERLGPRTVILEGGVDDTVTLTKAELTALRRDIQVLPSPPAELLFTKLYNLFFG